MCRRALIVRSKVPASTIARLSHSARGSADVIQRKGPSRHLDAVEFATLEWVDWSTHDALVRLDTQLNEIALSDRGTLRGLTQFRRTPCSHPRNRCTQTRCRNALNSPACAIICSRRSQLVDSKDTERCPSG